MPLEVIKAFAILKKSAAVVNIQYGLSKKNNFKDEKVSKAIV